MRLRALPAVGISVAALALATSLSGAANAGASPSLIHQGGAAASSSITPGSCYSNLTDDSGYGIVSQNFEAAYDAYDDQGAVDFSLSAKCKIRTVKAPGVYFAGAGPADNETVTFYKAKNGKPGKILSSKTVAGDDSGGTFTIKLKKPVTLKAGSYFVSVQANVNFDTAGEWGWETTTNQIGAGDLWRNPGDGFGTGCTTYMDMISCFGAQGQGPDFMIELSS